MVKNPPAKQTWVQSLGWEHSLEKEMATPPRILPKISMDRGARAGMGSMGLQRVGHDLVTQPPLPKTDPLSTTGNFNFRWTLSF